MPRHTAKIIINPSADLGRAWRSAADLRPVIDEFGGADWSGSAYPTHASELAQLAAEDGYQLVIAAGGDGTVHEVVNGLMRVPAAQRPVLGVIPLGTGNDFAHTIGMPPAPISALRQIFTGKPRAIDIGLLQDDRGRSEYWDNTLGIGFDATVTIRSRKFTYLRGFLVYLISVLQTILLNHAAPRMVMTSDQESWDEKTLMLTICNGPREGGGFLIAPHAAPDDDIFDYAAVRKVSRLMMLRLLPEFMRGTHQGFKAIRMGKLHRASIQADAPLTIHTDGEIFAGFGVDIRKLSVEILPGALQVMC
jgi:YegS/Rv2252/BmrU family lipid kinase